MKLKISICPSVRANLHCSFQCETPCITWVLTKAILLSFLDRIFFSWIFIKTLLCCFLALSMSTFDSFKAHAKWGKNQVHCQWPVPFWSQKLSSFEPLQYLPLEWVTKRSSIHVLLASLSVDSKKLYCQDRMGQGEELWTGWLWSVSAKNWLVWQFTAVF